MFIRIFLVLFVLTCSVSNALAEWKEITATDNFTLYANPASRRIDKESGLVKMWILIDLKTARKVDDRVYLSVKSQNQYDCKEERSRTLAESYFSGHMANGEVVVIESTEGIWQPVGLESLGEALLKLACGTSKKLSPTKKHQAL